MLQKMFSCFIIYLCEIIQYKDFIILITLWAYFIIYLYEVIQHKDFTISITL